MAIALVNHVLIPGGASSSGIDTTGADLLVASAAEFNGTATILDSYSNTWSALYNYFDPAGPFGVVAYYVLNPVVGPGHTFSVGTTQFGSGAVQAFSGVAAVQTNNGIIGVTSGSSIQPGSITPAVNGSLVVSSVAYSGQPSDNSTVIDSGFTLTDQYPYTGGVAFGNAMAYLIQPTAGAVNPTFSWTGSTSNANAGIAWFTPIAGHTISGNAGVASATVSWTGTSSGSTTADGSGNYTTPALGNGSYVVVPSLAGFTFTPTSRNVTLSGSNVTSVNFTATAQASVYSQPDCRIHPNGSRSVNHTLIYDVQTSSNPIIPPTDDRKAGAPVASGTYPQNDRNPAKYNT